MNGITISLFNGNKESKSRQILEDYNRSLVSGEPFEPSSIPLDHNLPFYPYPFDFEKLTFKSPVSWIWLKIVLDRQFLTSCSILICTFISTMLYISIGGLFGRVNPRTTLTFALIFTIITFILIWYRVNLARNENYRHSLCFAYAKSNQAKEIWKNHGDKMYAKDVFYSTKTFLGDIQVLRDGTVDLIPPRIDEEANNGKQSNMKVDGEGNVVEVSSGGKFGTISASNEKNNGVENV